MQDFSFNNYKCNPFNVLFGTCAIAENEVIINNRADVLNSAENMKRTEYLQMHKNEITLGKDGYYRTYLPLTGGKRKQIKKKHLKDLQDVVIEFWKNNSTSTFKIRYEIWVDRQKQCGRSDNTICKYESDYIRFFQGDEIENKDIRDIDAEYLYKFLERLLKKKDISYRALKSMMGYIKGVFEKSITDGLIKESPCNRIDLPIFRQYCKQPLIKTVEERTMSYSEKNALLNSLEKNYIKKPTYIVQYALELSLYTGMRVSELSGLMWEDIDYEHKTILIRHGERYNRKTKEFYVIMPKNGKIRTFPLTQEINDLLNRVKNIETELGYLSEYVFSNENGRIHARTISECMRLRTSGNEFHNTKCIHSARRTLNSELIASGVPRQVCCAIIGNTEKTNEQYYTYDVTSMDYKLSVVSNVNKQYSTSF